jgi:HECT-domain (ubiquitin-transferase)
MPSPSVFTDPSYRKRTHLLRVIGQFVAKAMLDSRIIDLSFNKNFLKQILGEDVPLTIASLKVGHKFMLYEASLIIPYSLSTSNLRTLSPRFKTL